MRRSRSTGRRCRHPLRDPVPSAQVKSAVLLAGLAADGHDHGRRSRAATRDHTERALAALGAPSVERRGRRSRSSAFQHEASTARCRATPPRPRSSSRPRRSRLGARDHRASASTRRRLHFLEVMRRMGVETRRARRARRSSASPWGRSPWRAGERHPPGTRSTPTSSAGHRRGARARRPGGARARRLWFLERGGAPGEGERPARRARRRDPRRSAARGRRGRRSRRRPAAGSPGGRGVRAATTGWRWRSRWRRSARDGPCDDRGDRGRRRVSFPGFVDDAARGSARRSRSRRDGAARSSRSTAPPAAASRTLRAALAAALGLPYVNTGLMYRALAAAALASGRRSRRRRGALARLAAELAVHACAAIRPTLEVEGYGRAEL